MSVSCPGICGCTFTEKRRLAQHLLKYGCACGQVVINRVCCEETFNFGFQLGQHLIESRALWRDHNFYETQLEDEVSKVSSIVYKSFLLCLLVEINFLIFLFKRMTMKQRKNTMRSIMVEEKKGKQAACWMRCDSNNAFNLVFKVFMFHFFKRSRMIASDVMMNTWIITC